ncbi:MAG TPA: alkaline phosphatase family protein [Candidatus Cybelea sp.]
MKSAAFLTIAALLCGCGADRGFAQTAALDRSTIPAARLAGAPASAKIRHVVIVFQENRSVDDLFNGLRGADTVKTGLDSHNRRVSLAPISLTAPYDISHEHSAFLVERANGKLNGWDLVHSSCRTPARCPGPQRRAFGYVPRPEVEPYFTMAERYTFADRMFQSNEGPSFPAHQYIISGTSTLANGSQLRAASNAFKPLGGFTGGCDSPPGSFVYVIDAAGNENQATYPCFNRTTIMDLLEQKALSWRYYQQDHGAGLWEAPDAIWHIRHSKEFTTDVVFPPKQLLKDISAGRLANVVWVTPTSEASDHGGTTNGTGPSWVATVVNAIGRSQYWNNTAIFVTWDDWGGWYDHVPPPSYNSYELGFRVPLIVISPYAKQRYISQKQHEFGSILKFIEVTFGLPSLGTTDVRSDDLSDCFDFGGAPRRFVPIEAPLGPRYFLNQPESTEPIDY